MSGRALVDRERYRADMDGLRAVAVAMVVIYHAWPAAMPGGFAGVDVFFAVSGYLITGIALREMDAGSFRFSVFYQRRARRILPSLALVMAATLAAGYLLLPYADFAALGSCIVRASTFVANIGTWRDFGYFDASAETKPLLHLWSLSVEEQFYLLWPLALTAAWRLPRSRVPAALGLITLVSFAVCVVWTAHDPTGAYLLLPPRLWQLSAGGALAAFERAIRAPDPRLDAWRTALFAAGAAALATCAWTLDPATYPGTQALLPTVGALAVLHAGWSPGASCLRVLCAPPLPALGKISYPLYLWHWPILVLARLHGPVPQAETIALVVLSIALSWATTKWVERPALRLRTTPDGGLRAAFAALSLFGVFSASTSLAAEARLASMPQWLQEATVRAAEVAADHSPYGYRTCFLQTDQGPGDFDASCAPPPDGRPLVALWGDSHAAHLYPGLKALSAQAGFRLAEFAVGACAPAPGVDQGPKTPNCMAINARIAGEILPRLHPDVVVLSARWSGYNGIGWPKIGPDAVARVVRMLRELGVPKVLVSGPAPVWRNGLPTTLGAYYAAVHAPSAPERLPLENAPAMRSLDAALRAAVESAGGEYFSILSLLCPADMCLATLATASGTEPFAPDDAHFTPEASVVIARSLAPRLAAAVAR
jgi:peptidoglycan/LPS O-acetylase OafA/YrhL